jgi:hypothetical protein
MCWRAQECAFAPNVGSLDWESDFAFPRADDAGGRKEFCARQHIGLAERRLVR